MDLPGRKLGRWCWVPTTPAHVPPAGEPGAAIPPILQGESLRTAAHRSRASNNGAVSLKIAGVARRAYDFVRAIAAGARDDRITGLAGEVAFFGALSVFPGILSLGAAVTVLGAIGVEAAESAEASLLAALERVLTVEGNTLVDATRKLLERGNTDVFTVAVILALWSGSRGIDAVITAVALVSNVDERRSWWRRRAVAFSLLVATVLAVAVVLSMLVAGPLLGGGHAVAEAFGLGPTFVAAWSVLRVPLAAAALVLWVLTVLHVARPRRRRWRDDVPGALVATALGLAASVGLRVYLATVGQANPVLGVLGGPLILLLWLFLLAASLLIGAEVAQQWRERAVAQPRSPSARAK